MSANAPGRCAVATCELPPSRPGALLCSQHEPTTVVVPHVRAKSEIEGCTCEIDPITMRRYSTGDDCPVHPRVTHDSIAWEKIPEQVVCICSHIKGLHSRKPRARTATICTAGNAAALRAIADALETKGVPTAAPAGCHCHGFYDVDERMPWELFADRLLAETPQPIASDPGTRKDLFAEVASREAEEKKQAKQRRARARTALAWAWKKSGLDLEKPSRTWALWLADSARVWQAWREAGSPIEAFGREVSFGPCSIPALEENRHARLSGNSEERWSR